MIKSIDRVVTTRFMLYVGREVGKHAVFNKWRISSIT